MVPDMMTIVFHGTELAEVKFGDTVIVLGIGPVGLMALSGAKLIGKHNLLLLVQDKIVLIYLRNMVLPI